MCNLYRMKSNATEIGSLFNARNAAGNLPVFDAVYPDRDAPIVRSIDGDRTLEIFTWGFPPPGQAKRPVTNVRNLTSPFWLSALKRPDRRCLVPVTSFCEWEGKPGAKRKVWFELKDRPLFAFAGIWRPVEADCPRFAFLTCTPNQIVGAVHPKAMPVILTEDMAEDWLAAPWEEAAKLARPFPDSRMKMTGDF
ncbi:hypothetical protein B5C34_05375 [Pacificimonas flava]|uniref:Abasic site processing protein n=2 Tax=Pacificimonas TaxID=1960290 RepID=A0A219B478_9SPHN|nr:MULTISPECIES: SOS response-associated peptidase family protein [Pacificimonas]MBZ6377349.1 SOS response-associated peptidase family protein [Pacificimonas aurantium]OWV32943.1 hypothetical protein B5C34_05375 [Pacificimonas flava]